MDTYALARILTGAANDLVLLKLASIRLWLRAYEAMH